MKRASLVLALILAGAMAIAGSQRASAQPAAAGKSSIAVIDIVKVFNSVNDKRNGDIEIEKMANDLKKQRDSLQADLEELKKELNGTTVKPESPEGKETLEKAMKKGLELQNFSDYMREKLSLEQRVRTAALYKKINDAVRVYADAHGIQIVLTYDTDNMADAQTAQELQARISVRKVLYAHESLDITKAITEAMNTATHLGG